MKRIRKLWRLVLSTDNKAKKRRKQQRMLLFAVFLRGQIRRRLCRRLICPVAGCVRSIFDASDAAAHAYKNCQPTIGSGRGSRRQKRRTLVRRFCRRLPRPDPCPVFSTRQRRVEKTGHGTTLSHYIEFHKNKR